MRLSRIIGLLSMATLGWFGTGCTTSKLWEGGSLVHSHFPASPPNISVYHAEYGNDLLVEYDEADDYNDSIVRRAYWLRSSQSRILDKQKPHFVSPETARNLQEIPVEPAGQDSNATISGISFSTNSMALTVVLDTGHPEDFELPRYADSTGTTKKVILTPLALGADATIIGGALGYLYLNALRSQGRSY